jgi:lipopolysaccharide export system protein LptA
MTRCILFILFLLAMLASSSTTSAQQPTDTGRTVDILHADRLGLNKRDTANPIQYGSGNVAAQQNKTLFYSDSAVLAEKKKMFQAFGHVHINDADSTHIYGDYMRYHFDTKMAYMQKNVTLTDGKTTLTTQELEYDLNQKIGTYKNGGKVLNGSSVLTSKEGVYYDDLKDVFFRKNVVLIDPKYTLKADSLLYNTQTEIATFIGPTTIIDSTNRTIHTSEGFYDMKNRIAQFGKRPVINDGKTRLVADSIYADDASGIRTAKGSAVYTDSTQGISIMAGELNDNARTNLVVASKKPLMIIKQDKDSIYVTADTILSGFLNPEDTVVGKRKVDSLHKVDTIKGKVVIAKATANNPTDTSSSNRYIKAYHHVRIFSDSLQAVSDSLYYSGVDSIFRFYTDPIVWANGNQVTGDTIFLYTKNKKPERLYVFENGLVINKTGPDQYNQIKGTTLNGYFVDGQMDHMRARGSAESIYYIKDEDSAYVGANRTTADVIDMRFLNKELNKVVFVNDVKGTTTPFKHIKFDEMRLRNFKWLDERRPKTKFELFGD